MGVVHTPDSEYAKEKVKWEAHHTAEGPPGRPYQYHEFPKMMYRADRIDHGPLGIVEQRVAESEREELNLKSRGFASPASEAIKVKEREQFEHAELAAERNYDVVKRLGEKAREEVMRAEAAHGSEHLPSVPVTPIRRPVPASDDTLNKQKANQAARDAVPDPATSDEI